MKFGEMPQGRAPEAVREDPKRIEETKLKRLASSKYGRYLVPAMLALSSQGCASFKDTVGIAMGEGPTSKAWGVMPNVDVRPESSKATIGLSSYPEKPGIEQWWNVPEGLYLPDTMRGSAPSHFSGLEKKPTEPTAIAHFASGDITPRDASWLFLYGNEETGVNVMYDGRAGTIWRSVEKLSPVLQPHAGIAISLTERSSITRAPSDVKGAMFDTERVWQDVLAHASEARAAIPGASAWSNRAWGAFLNFAQLRYVEHSKLVPTQMYDITKEKVKAETEWHEKMLSAIRDIKRLIQADVPDASVRKEGWLEAQAASLVDQARTEIGVSGPLPDITVKATSLVDVRPTGTGSGFEGMIIAGALTRSLDADPLNHDELFTGFSTEGSKVHPDHPSGVGVLFRRVMPEWQGLSEGEYQERFTHAKDEALQSAIMRLTPFLPKGSADMRLHVVLSDDRKTLAVAGIVDDPAHAPALHAKAETSNF